METITKLDYLKYAIDNKLYGYLNWIQAVLSLGVDDDTYLKIKDGQVIVKIDDIPKILITTSLPIFTKEEPIEIPKGFLPNVEAPILTNAFKILLNAILLTEHFHDKIPYMNDEISVKGIEKEIVKRLSDTPSPENTTIQELVSFQDSVTYLYGFAPLVVNSNSPLLLLPPPGIKEYRKKVIEEIKKKYNVSEIADYAHIAEVEAKLEEYDTKFLEKDPSYKKFISGKIKNGRKKMFLSYGAEQGFDPEAKPYYSQNSLAEGWEPKAEAIATYYNGSRAGSYGRGGETAEGGLLAKIALRATNSILVKQKDCGTKIGKVLAITKDNFQVLNGKSIIENGKTIKVKNSSDYIGKTVTLRTVSYCKEGSGNFCSVCMGDNLSRNETSVAGAIANFGSIMLHIKMKAHHATGAKLAELDIDDMVI